MYKILLILHLLVLSVPTYAVDCENSDLVIENIICTDSELAKYNNVITETKNKIEQYEDDFVKKKINCKTTSCLKELYKRRVELTKHIDSIYEDYKFEKDTDLRNKLTNEPVGRAGILQLVNAKKLMIIDEMWKKKLFSEEAGISFFPIDTFNPNYSKTGKIIPEDAEYSDCSRGPLDLACGLFLMTDKIDYLPEGLYGSHRIILIIPQNLPLPTNLGHSEAFYINKTLQELGFEEKYNCSNTDSLFETVMCNSRELQDLKADGDLALAEILKTLADEDDRYDLEREDFVKNEKIKNCTTISCIKMQYQERLQYFKSKEYQKKYQPLTLPEGCVIPTLPAEYETYIISNYGSRVKSDIKIDNRHTTFKNDIWINRPDKNIVLVLTAYEPMVWDLHITPQTKLIAVYAGGFYESRLRGVPEETITDISNCGIKYDSKPAELKSKVRKLGILGKDYHVLTGKNVIGQKLDRNSYMHSKKIIGGDGILLQSLTGIDGLNQQVEYGNLIEITSSIASMLKKKGTQVIGKIDNPASTYSGNLNGTEIELCQSSAKTSKTCLGKSYILWNEIAELPKGLTGDDAVKIYVPKDMKIPENQGENQFYRLNKTRLELEDIEKYGLGRINFI